MTLTQRFAFWVAVFLVVLAIGQIWRLSVFLTNYVLIPQLGYEIASFGPLLLCGILVMAAINLARLTLASSFAIGMIALMAKAPIF